MPKIIPLLTGMKYHFFSTVKLSLLLNKQKWQAPRYLQMKGCSKVIFYRFSLSEINKASLLWDVGAKGRIWQFQKGQEIYLVAILRCYLLESYLPITFSPSAFNSYMLFPQLQRTPLEFQESGWLHVVLTIFQVQFVMLPYCMGDDNR